MAASFPTAFTLLSEQLNVSGKIATAIIMSAAFGEMALPALTAALMGKNGPQAFLRCILVFAIITCMAFLWWWVYARRKYRIEWYVGT